jgi:hypothetical protein
MMPAQASPLGLRSVRRAPSPSALATHLARCPIEHRRQAFEYLSPIGNRQLARLLAPGAAAGPRRQLSRNPVTTLPPVGDAAKQVLKGLGLTDAKIASFATGDVVLFELPVAGTDSTIGLLQLKADAVRGGIFSIKVPADPNAAIKSFMQVRGRVLDVARAVNTPEIELIGAAVHNEKIVKMLEKQGFTRSTEVLPESLGLGPNAEAEIYSKRFPVSPAATPAVGAEGAAAVTDGAKPTSSYADPTAGPPAPGRKGPAFKPQPYDPDRAYKPTGSVNGAQQPPTAAGGPVGETPPPATAPPAAVPGEAETLAAAGVRDDFVAKMAAEREALVLRPGRYAMVGGVLYAVVVIGSVVFFINDVIAKGPIEATKEWGLMAILSARIAATAGGAVAGVVGMVIFMPSDQAGAAEQAVEVERLDVIDGIIHDAFDDVVGPRRVLCIGDCTATSSTPTATRRCTLRSARSSPMPGWSRMTTRPGDASAPSTWPRSTAVRRSATARSGTAQSRSSPATARR